VRVRSRGSAGGRPHVLNCSPTCSLTRSLTYLPTYSLASDSFASFRGALDALPAATPVALLGTFGLLVAFVIGGKNGALPAEADGLVRGAGLLLAGGGIGATFFGLVLQNVAETGNPGKKK